MELFGLKHQLNISNYAIIKNIKKRCENTKSISSTRAKKSDNKNEKVRYISKRYIKNNKVKYRTYISYMEYVLKKW